MQSNSILAADDLSMPLTNDDIHNFYQFALGALRTQAPETSMQELVNQWDAQRERESVNASIRKGHAEIATGGGQAYDEFRAELKANYSQNSDT